MSKGNERRIRRLEQGDGPPHPIFQLSVQRLFDIQVVRRASLGTADLATPFSADHFCAHTTSLNVNMTATRLEHLTGLFEIAV